MGPQWANRPKNIGAPEASNTQIWGPNQSTACFLILFWGPIGAPGFVTLTRPILCLIFGPILGTEDGCPGWGPQVQSCCVCWYFCARSHAGRGARITRIC